MNEICRCIESEYPQLQWLDASAPDWTGSNFHSHDRGIATFTVKARPPIRCPCNTSIASCNLRSSANVTNPKPRDLPLELLRTISADSVWNPQDSIHCLRSSSEELCGIFPINSLAIRNTSTSRSVHFHREKFRFEENLFAPILKLDNVAVLIIQFVPLDHNADLTAHREKRKA